MQTEKSETKDLIQHGFCILTEQLESALIDQIISDCEDSFEITTKGVLSRGQVYAARNLLDVVPIVKTFWQHGFIRSFLENHLGNDLGLVRVLYFDKPPKQTWSLPWHKDTAIAVRDNKIESKYLTRPTIKSGIPHVIASDDILREMLTLRVHLDEVTLENGPLKVIPGSHKSSSVKENEVATAQFIQASRGQILAMKPLLTHSSGASKPGTNLHRRILHLEFAGHQDLPDSYQWHDFVPLTV